MIKTKERKNGYNVFRGNNVRKQKKKQCYDDHSNNSDGRYNKHISYVQQKEISMAKDIEISLELLKYFQLILISGVLHEFGHYFLAKYYKLEPKIKIYGQFICVVYKGTDYKKNLSILFAGIIAGLIYIIYMIKDKPFYILNIAIMIGYTIGCISDILQIYYYTYGRLKNVT